MVDNASYKYVLCSDAISLWRIVDILNCENKYLSSISWIIFTLRSYVFIHKSTFKNPILVYIAYTNSQSIFLLVPIPIFHRLLVRVDIYVLHNHDYQQQLMYNLQNKFMYRFKVQKQVTENLIPCARIISFQNTVQSTMVKYVESEMIGN